MPPSTAPDFWSVFPALNAIFTQYQKVAQMPAGTLAGQSLADRDPRVLDQLLPWWEWLYHYYFRVSSDGWEHMPVSGPTLLVGTHNGGSAAPDMFMMMCDWFWRFGTDRPVYGLMHPKVWQITPDLARLATLGGAVQAHPKMAIAALRQNASVLVYPGGAQDLFRPYALRNKVHFLGRQGFIKLALREEVPIIPMISCGAHETFVVLADIYALMKRLNELGLPWIGLDPEVFPIYIGLPWGIGIGPLPHIPVPVKIHTRTCAPIVFDRYGPEAAQDKQYVSECYAKVCDLMQDSLNQLVQDHHKK